MLLKLEVCYPSVHSVASGRDASESTTEVVVFPTLLPPPSPRTALPNPLEEALPTSVHCLAPWPALGPSQQASVIGYSFTPTNGSRIPRSFFARLQVRLFMRVDRECLTRADYSRVAPKETLSAGPVGGTCGGMPPGGDCGWLVYREGGARIDVVVFGAPAGTSGEGSSGEEQAKQAQARMKGAHLAGLLVRMVCEMQLDYPGMQPDAGVARLRRGLLCPECTKRGLHTPLGQALDEQGLRDFAHCGRTVMARQRVLLARLLALRLPADAASQLATKIADMLPELDATRRLLLRSRAPVAVGSQKVVLEPRRLLLLQENGRLDAAATGMVEVLVQPAPATVLRGERVALRVEARGSAPLSYQWFLGAKKLPHQTESTLLVERARRDDEGTYRCLVSNHVGSVRTEAAVLITYVTRPDRCSAPRLSDACADGFSVSWEEPLSFGETLVEYRLQLRALPDQQPLVGGAAAAAEAAAAKGPAAAAQVGPQQAQGSNVLSLEGYRSPLAEVRGLGLDTSYAVRAAARSSAGWGEYGPWSAPARTLAVPLPKLSAVVFTGHTEPDAGAEHADAGEHSVLVKSAPVHQLQALADVRVAVLAMRLHQAVLEISANDGDHAGATNVPLLQWFRDGVEITGATESRLVLDAVSDDDSGTYTCRAKNRAGSVTSSGVTLHTYSPLEVHKGDCVMCDTNTDKVRPSLTLAAAQTLALRTARTIAPLSSFHPPPSLVLVATRCTSCHCVSWLAAWHVAGLIAGWPCL